MNLDSLLLTEPVYLGQVWSPSCSKPGRDRGICDSCSNSLTLLVIKPPSIRKTHLGPSFNVQADVCRFCLIFVLIIYFSHDASIWWRAPAAKVPHSIIQPLPYFTGGMLFWNPKASPLFSPNIQFIIMAEQLNLCFVRPWNMSLENQIRVPMRSSKL